MTTTTPTRRSALRRISLTAIAAGLAVPARATTRVGDQKSDHRSQRATSDIKPTVVPARIGRWDLRWPPKTGQAAKRESSLERPVGRR
jgi:hypothetical protein